MYHRKTHYFLCMKNKTQIHSLKEHAITTAVSMDMQTHWTTRHWLVPSSSPFPQRHEMNASLCLFVLNLVDERGKI